LDIRSLRAKDSPIDEDYFRDVAAFATKNKSKDDIPVDLPWSELSIGA
jgi:hypothetical protein